MASHVVSFRFSSRAGGAMAFRLVPFLVSWQRFVRIGVPFLVSFLVLCWRPVRVSWVGVLVSALAFRFSFRLVVPSCLGVPWCWASRVGVVLLRRFCQLVFPCCLVWSCRCRRSIRVRPVGRVGWRVVGAWRGGGAWLMGSRRCSVALRCAWRYAMRGDGSWRGAVR